MLLSMLDLISAQGMPEILFIIQNFIIFVVVVVVVDGYISFSTTKNKSINKLITIIINLK